MADLQKKADLVRKLMQFAIRDDVEPEAAKNHRDRAATIVKKYDLDPVLLLDETYTQPHPKLQQSGNIYDGGPTYGNGDSFSYTWTTTFDRDFDWNAGRRAASDSHGAYQYSTESTFEERWNRLTPEQRQQVIDSVRRGFMNFTAAFTDMGEAARKASQAMADMVATYNEMMAKARQRAKEERERKVREENLAAFMKEAGFRVASTEPNPSGSYAENKHYDMRTNHAHCCGVWTNQAMTCDQVREMMDS